MGDIVRGYYSSSMTDKGLYEHIRRLVREQKAAQEQLDVGQENFAQEYCRFEMMKKRTVHAQENRMNTLLKNFKNVESYINIMDIISNLQLSLAAPNDPHPTLPEDALPEIIPKSLQLKIREELGPILSKRYEEDSLKREELARTLREALICSGEELRREERTAGVGAAGAGVGEGRQRFQLIDVLRKDIRRKEVYFLEQRFDRELDDIGQLPKKLQDTKMFHKICSYLHMILEQEHKEKWASRQDQRFRQDHRRVNVRRKMRIPTLIQNYSNQLTRANSSNFKTTNQSAYRQTPRNTALPKTAHFDDDVIDSCSQEEEGGRGSQERGQFRKVQSKQELVKENFTFRRRGIKAGLMVKINEFVDNLNDEEKKNSEASKKYGKALISLGEQLETSYGKFKREELAQEEDIEDMKKYLDNTLSRNKKDLKKFHHK